MIKIFTLIMLTLSLNVIAQTQTICGGSPPIGWVTISVNGYCTKNQVTTFISRTIRNIEGMPTGAELDICGGDVPAGWVSTIVKPGYCAQVGGNVFIGRRIKKIEGMPTGAELDICGSNVPAGWATTIVMPGYCAQVGGNVFIGRRIKKISGAREAADGSELEKADVDALNISVSPNPSSSSFKISIKSLNSLDPLRIEVYNESGIMIDNRLVFVTGQYDQELGATYISGIYFLKVVQKEKSKFLKLIKK